MTAARPVPPLTRPSLFSPPPGKGEGASAPGHAGQREVEAPFEVGARAAALWLLQVPALLLRARRSHGVVHDQRALRQRDLL